jgi:hypothetical protein
LKRLSSPNMQRSKAMIYVSSRNPSHEMRQQ